MCAPAVIPYFLGGGVTAVRRIASRRRIALGRYASLVWWDEFSRRLVYLSPCRLP